MGVFGQDVTVSLSKDNVLADNESASAVTCKVNRQFRKLEKEKYYRDLDRRYYELAYAKYDATNEQQMIDTMTQLAAFVGQTRFVALYPQRKFMKPYMLAARNNLLTGIALLRNLNPSNPIIDYFEHMVATWQEEDKRAAKQAAWAWFLCGLFIFAALFWPVIYIMIES